MSFDVIHDLIGKDSATIMWWQMSIRAVLIFVAGLLLIRIAGRRAFGRYSTLDTIFAVLIGSTLSRTLTANTPFFPTLVACAALAALHRWSADAARFSDHIVRILKGSPVRLIKDGRLDRQAMRRTGLSIGDVEEALRSHGILEVEQVKLAMFERSGRITVIGGRGEYSGHSRFSVT